MPRKPDSFEFSMSMIGGDEEKDLREYVQALETAVLVALDPNRVVVGLEGVSMGGQQAQMQ